MCDPMWHVSSRSGVATLRTAIHFLLTYLRTNRTDGVCLFVCPRKHMCREYVENELQRQ